MHDHSGTFAFGSASRVGLIWANIRANAPAALCCFSISVFSFLALVPNAAGAERESSRRVTAVLAYQLGALPKASVSLGSLATGESSSIKIDLQNALDEKFVFAEIKTSCSCKQIVPSKGAVEVGGSLELEFTLNVPKHMRGVARHGLLEFVDSTGRVVGLLEFSFANPNYIGFRTDLLVVEYSCDTLELDVPLDLGDDVEKDDYRLICDQLSLSEKLSGKTMLLTAKARGDSLLSGRVPLKLVRVDDNGDSVVDTLVIIAQKKANLEIVPKVIRFQVSEDEQFLLGAVFLSARGDLKVASAIASLEVSDKPYGFTVKELSKGSARLGLKIPISLAKQISEDRVTGVVQVRCGDASAKDPSVNKLPDWH